MASVLENLQQIQLQIHQACVKSLRNPNEIKVIAVTKYVSIARMKEALNAGIHHFGESKAQDAVPKWEELGSQGIWHFIGHLQSNKVKEIIGKYTFIHSLDRPSLAKEIEKRAQAHDTVVSCFVQVNVSGEGTKQGVSSVEAVDFIHHLSKYPHIQVVGLMTMAPHVENPEETRPVFKQLKQLQRRVQSKNWSHAPVQELSMGMSNDFQIAIEEGATFVRLGTSLVGKDDEAVRGEDKDGNDK